MLFSLIEKLPIELVGAAVLHYLGIRDIVMVERACGSKASHQHFLDLIPRSPAISLSSSNRKDIACFEWFAKRICKIKCLTITLPGNNPALHVKNLHVKNLDITLTSNVTMESCTHLFESHLICRVGRIVIFEYQNKDVIEQLSLLTGEVEKLHISDSDNYHDWLSRDVLSRWKLKEIHLNGIIAKLATITLIVQTCSELTTVVLSDTVDDAVVMVVAEHCLKLEKLDIIVRSGITYHSLLALSERGLPQKELAIPYIPNIPTADIARRCSHALSCIRHLSTYNNEDANIFIVYMTGLSRVVLHNDCLSYIPLLTQHCHKLTHLSMFKYTNSVTDVLSLCHANPLLLELFCYNTSVFTDTALIELAHACPHLQRLHLPRDTTITDISILALSEHCTQLEYLHIAKCAQITEVAVLQLLHSCRKLTILEVSSNSLSEETWTQLDKNTQKRVSRW